MSRISLLLITLICFSPTIAQKPLYNHQQWYKVEDGLPQSFVSDITQDDDGFIWISTLDGLARYDGRSFRVFKQRQGDSTSISSNVIYRLTRSEDNLFWIYYQGLQIETFNPRTLAVMQKKPLQVIDIRKNIKSAYFEDAGKFWTYLADSGVGWFDPTTHQRWVANIANGLLRDDNIIGSTHLSNGSLILLSRFSLQISDSLRKKFSYVKLTQPLPTEVAEQTPVQMTFIQGKLFVITKRDAWIFDINTGNYIRYPMIITGDLRPGIRTLRKGPDGRLYIRGDEKIYRMEFDGSFTLIWENTVLPGRRITSFLIDKTEVLWVGIDAAGLIKVNLRSMPLNTYDYKRSFHADILEKLGIDTLDMPAKWSKGDWSYNFRYAYGPDSTIYLSRNDSAMPINQLFAYNNRKLTPLPISNKMTTLRGISVDKKGGIWALDNYNNGIWFWESKSSEPIFYLLPEISAQVNQFADLFVTDKFQWITTYGKGLFKTATGAVIEHADKKTKPNTILYDLTNICPDPFTPDLLWIGSLGGGLICWDINKGLKRIFTTEDGLPNNTVYCIAPDKLGKLWLSTNKGVARFDPRNFEIQLIEKSDGLPGNEFNRFHEFIFPDGRIAFGGVDGYVIFQPTDFSLRHDTLAPSIQITDITINNQSQKPGTRNSLIKEPLNSISYLLLPYNKNYLTISFAALQFNEPQKIKYRYRLKGLNDSWTEIGYNNSAYYTNLRPGKYTLEINATNLNGNWSNAVRELVIKILPPIWASWWAYGIYGISAFCVLLAYLKYRENRLKVQQELLFEHRESARLRELDEVKTQFFSNITHEFRTPLTLIISPLEKISKQTSLPAPVLQTVDMVQRNASILLKLINQLLDLSKLESGQMKISYSTGELNEYVKDAVETLRSGAIEKNIRLSFNSTNIAGLYRFDEEKWDKIINNLVGNALKFTPNGGSVSVSLQHIPNSEFSNPNIKMVVEDSGPGIPNELLTKIFERFYQVDYSNTRQYQGSGIGLSLIKELVKLMHGNIIAENRPNGGARFIVELPVEKCATQISSLTQTQTNGVQTQEPNLSEKDTPLVLVVEDNYELRQFLVESFAQRWRIIEADNGIAGWNKILDEMPDIIISDLMMPGRDGVELCSLCKNDPRTAHIGFILLTAKSSHAVKIEGLGRGADAYITKPFHLDELELNVYNILQLHEKLSAYLQLTLFPDNPNAEVTQVENPFIKRLYELLDEKLDDPQLNVEYLAASTNMSRSSLNRKLKNLINVSANELIRRYRLQKAASLLRAGEEITITAYKTGFSSPSYFSQCFREQYNLTPSEYVSRLV